MKPLHTHFFSSLKQVEKRLKLDNKNPPPQQQTETQSTESSSTSSPLYFHTHHTNTSSSTLNNNNSIEQPPHEFLSINHSQPNPNNQLNNHPENNFSQNDVVGDVDCMIGLLGLSEFEGKGIEMPDVGDDEFYDKIVKVKGPKCKKEVERLDGWVNYLLNSEKEPFRLAHLLLAKSAVMAGGGGGGGGDVIEFPSTVEEFLHSDPPDEGGRRLEPSS